jgi:hypothetical protein
MTREEVRRVLAAIYDGGLDELRDRRIIEASPTDAVRAVLAHERLKASGSDVTLLGAFLLYPPVRRNLDLSRTLRRAEDEVAAAMSSAQPAHLLSLTILHTIIWLGAALLVVSAITAGNGRDLVAAVLGGSGIAMFVGAFLTWPASAIRRSVANRVQLELVYMGFSKEFSLWMSFAANESSVDDPVSVDTAVMDELQATGRRAIELIDRYCRLRDQDADEPRRSEPEEPSAAPGMGALPSTSQLSEAGVGAKFHMEKSLIVDKSPLEKSPHADHTPAQSSSVAEFAMERTGFGHPPPDLADRMAAKTAHDHAPTSSALPFALATGHQAPEWEQHEPGGLAAALADVESALTVCDELVRQLAAREDDLTSAERERLAALRTRHAQLEADHDRIRAKHDATP